MTLQLGGKLPLCAEINSGFQIACQRERKINAFVQAAKNVCLGFRCAVKLRMADHMVKTGYLNAQSGADVLFCERRKKRGQAAVIVIGIHVELKQLMPRPGAQFILTCKEAACLVLFGHSFTQTTDGAEIFSLHPVEDGDDINIASFVRFAAPVTSLQAEIFSAGCRMHRTCAKPIPASSVPNQS